MSQERDPTRDKRPYLGKVGEYRVLATLLELGIEAYPAIRSNQQDYDITAIPRPDRVVRIQVKTTELNNKSTNNAISGTDKAFDFLVLVVIEDIQDRGKRFPARFFILTRDEVFALRGDDKLLGVSFTRGGEYLVREAITGHEDKWEKIDGV